MLRYNQISINQSVISFIVIYTKYLKQKLNITPALQPECGWSEREEGWSSFSKVSWQDKSTSAKWFGKSWPKSLHYTTVCSWKTFIRFSNSSHFYLYSNIDKNLMCKRSSDSESWWIKAFTSMYTQFWTYFQKDTIWFRAKKEIFKEKREQFRLFKTDISSRFG